MAAPGLGYFVPDSTQVIQKIISKGYGNQFEKTLTYQIWSLYIKQLIESHWIYKNHELILIFISNYKADTELSFATIDKYY